MPYCPSCGSSDVEPCDTFFKAGAATGVATGIVLAVPDVVLFPLFGPLPMMATVAASTVAGAAAGEALDKRFPRYRCTDCKHKWTERADS